MSDQSSKKETVINGGDELLHDNGDLVEDRNIFRQQTAMSNNRGLWALIIIIVIITAGAISMVPDDEVAVENEQIEPITRLPSTASTAETPGESARSMIKKLRSSRDGSQAAYDAAQKEHANGQLTDAYLLYFFAARQGSAAAALELGSQADPTYYNEKTSSLDGPDMAQAYKWYRLAMSAGNSEAESRLTKLHDHIALQASRGDTEAERLLLQWK